MRKTNSDKLNLDKVIDLMFEPKKNRFSVLVENGSRQELTYYDFKYIMSIFNYCNLLTKD